MLYDKLMNPKGALAAVVLSMLLTGSLSVEAARKKTVQKIKVACVGNSITYGTESRIESISPIPYNCRKCWATNIW